MLTSPAPSPMTATIPTMARLADVGESKIRELIRDNKLQTITIGKRRLIVVDSYRKLIEVELAEPPKDARRNNAGLPFGSRGGHIGKGPSPGVAAPKPAPSDNILDRPVDQLDLGTRAANALRQAGLILVGDLVQQTEETLLKLPNFGRRSLAEVEAELAKMQLKLGTPHPDWERRRDIVAA